MTSKFTYAAAVIAALMLGTAPIAGAQTFTQTLKSALQNSPTIDVNRAALRATEEGVIQAGAARRFQLDADARAALSGRDSTDWDGQDSYSAGLNASLLLLDGGRTKNAVASARAQVEAAEAQFSSIVQNTLLNAVTAFVDVRRDQQFVSLAQNNIRVINQQVAAARDRFEVGEVTRTDVSQAQARLASARSNLSSNQGRLERSRQGFINVTGTVPTSLGTPPALPKLPKSLADAERIAMKDHPQLVGARANITAAEFDLERSKGANRPTLSLNANIDYTRNTQIDGFDDTSASISLNGGMPLLSGGENASLVRQAQSILDRRKAELQDAARTVKQNVAFAWSDLKVARASIAASQQEIRAARLAFEGVQEEAKLGARTTLDALDAEQDVLNAESGLVSARRDEYVAAYNLILSMGLLSPEYLSLGTSTLDMGRASAAPVSRRGALVDQIRNRWSN